MTDQMPLTTRYRVEGMDCASCAAKITRAIGRIDGVADVRVSVTAGTMTVDHGGADGLLERIEKQVVTLGYGIRPADAAHAMVAAVHGHAHDHDHGGHTHDHDHGGHHSPSPSGRRGLEEPDEGPGTAVQSEAVVETPCSPPHPPLRGTFSLEGEGGAGHSHHHHHDDGPTDRPWWQRPKARLTLAAGLAMALAYAAGWVVPVLGHWPFVAAMLVGLVPVARRAIAAAMAGTPFSIEMLMVIAAVGAVIIGASEEACMVVFLFLVGELLEGLAAERARNSIRGLTALVPDIGRLERDGAIVETPADQLTVGMVVQVRPGDRLPADGTIIEGTSALNEAPVTGESVPKPKSVGEPVFAGTINGDGLLRVEVTAAARDNTIARIVRLVEEAQEAKAPTERFIDRFSAVYTPAVLAVGALVAVVPPLAFGGSWSDWVYKGLAILLIGCPCALVISTPAAIAAALANGARRGLLVKGGAVLEEAGRIDVVAFDKTGTLTLGKPAVTDIVALDGNPDDVLRPAAALEQGSSHPLAAAILARAAGLALPNASDVRAVPGKGVEGTVEGRAVALVAPRTIVEPGVAADLMRLTVEGKTVSVLVVDGTVRGLIAMSDVVRPDAGAGIAALKAIGIRALMLTGDNQATANAVGGPLGLDVSAELLPADKLAAVARLKDEGHIVAVVGDGINDAPALAAAHVGIAVGEGTDVALETADAAILNGRVGDVAALIGLSRAAMANIRQNIAVAVGLKLLFLVTTIIGLTGLWPAILADTGATVLVTANALRLLGARQTVAQPTAQA